LEKTPASVAGHGRVGAVPLGWFMATVAAFLIAVGYAYNEARETLI